MRFVVATFNPDKCSELEQLLADPRIELESLCDFTGAEAPDEDGATLADNARIKARAAVAHTGIAAIADDTGLEVDALDGRPGVHAARYAGSDATYADNVAKLIEALADVPHEQRTARFRCVCIARFPDGCEYQGEGTLEGTIIDTPRGAQGFGYDPIFQLPDGRTLAELEANEKNRISHRARAIQALAKALDQAGVLTPRQAR